MVTLGMAQFLAVIALQAFLLLGVTYGQTVQFTRSDYGAWNETVDNFAELAIQKVGKNADPFTVIIELRENEDFLTDSWSVTFPRNSPDPAVKTMRIPIKEDDIPEDDEIFEFRLRSTAKSKVQVGDPSLALVTIPANDDANGIASFLTQSIVYSHEAAGENATIKIPLLRSRGTFGNVAVTYVITRASSDDSTQTANVADDLFPEKGEIVFSEGEKEKDLTLFVKDDKIPEDDEHFEVTLTETTGGLAINQSSKVIKVVVYGNDCPIRFERNIYRVDESSNFVAAKITRGLDEQGVSRVCPDTSQVAVDYEVIPGTALPNEDYFGDRSTVSFEPGQQEKTVKIYLKDDELPELAENFTIRLLEKSISGDAIVAEPSSSTVVIEMNDKANGVLSIDLSSASLDLSRSEGDTSAFVIDEDASDRFDEIAVVRHGGAFQAISVEWTLTANQTENEDDVVDALSPTVGRLRFGVSQTRASVVLNVTQNDLPSEAKALKFRLLAETLTDGAELDSPAEVVLYLADSDDVYGVVGIDTERSLIQIDEESGRRNLLIKVVRGGGTTGEIVVNFVAAYFPPGENLPMPGTLSEADGQIFLKEGQVDEDLIVPIREDAFLDVDATFVATLKNVRLVDKKLLLPAKTPRLSTVNATLVVYSHLANGEIGFLDATDLYVDEPREKDGSLQVAVQLHRQGLSGDATVHISYSSVGDNSKDVLEAVDYTRGPRVVHLQPGQSEANITITVLPDDKPELEEAFVIRLDNVEPSNQKLKRSFTEKKIIIRASDSPGGVFEFAEDSNGPYILHEDEGENVMLSVQRSKGDLAMRMVSVDVLPNGSSQFYGIPTILYFDPGEREQNMSLSPREDSIPELDLNYTIVLQAHGDPPSVLGEKTTIHVTVLANNYPHGLFVFDDDGGKMPTKQTIGESKGENGHVAIFKVLRSKGSYGQASVSWKLLPGDTNDITPTTGLLEFDDGETESAITVQSLPDEIPESLEEFTFFLYNATMGSVASADTNATLIISPNDQAIYFIGASDVTAHEGKDLILAVHREGSGSDVTTLSYRVFIESNKSDERSATPNDDFSDAGGELTFRKGVLDLLITIPVYEDELPEDGETFYVELFDARGDYVTYGNSKIHVTIVQNDNANGVFELEPPFEIVAKEGVAHDFSIHRSRGTFGNVDVHWRIVSGSDWTYEEALISHLDNVATAEFIESEGYVTFAPGQRSVKFTVEARSDSVPEYDEEYMLVLFNVSNSRARLSSNSTTLMARIRIEQNDSPYGLIGVSPTSSNVVLAEDVLENDQMTELEPDVVKNNVTINVDRKMGTDGNVKVLWEIYPFDETPAVHCKDLLLSGQLIGTTTPVAGRPHTGTFAINFESSSFVRVDSEENQPGFPASGFTVSIWIKPDSSRLSNDDSSGENMEIILPLVTKHQNRDIIYSAAVEISKSKEETALLVKYRARVGEIVDVMKTELDEDVDLLDEQWHHLAVLQTSAEIRVYVDGELRGQLATFGDIIDVTSEQIETLVGKDASSNRYYHGIMQDVRVYPDVLSPMQIRDLFRSSANRDLTPVSGYLDYSAGNMLRNLSLTSIEDLETENNETFRLIFLDATGGGHVDNEGSGLVTVLKSDNANGLFGFARSCEPDVMDETGEVTCFINRSRGLSGEVIVEWHAGSVDSEDDKDFFNFKGNVTFLPGETEKSFVLKSAEDEIPEIDEIHNLTLVKTTPRDDVLSSASFSGASIDEGHALSFVTIRGNDKPNGVLQFSILPPPTAADRGKITEESTVPTLYVNEESEHVILTVVRAAGWFGHVTTEWRTRDSSAISQQEPRDFESAAGTLPFKDGQGYAFIDVRLFDDEDPEMEKYFFVELSAPTDGATLNNASRIKVVIEPSDDAFGIFAFNRSSSHVYVHEPAEGATVTTLQIVRNGGSLGESVVSWKIDDDIGNDVFPHDGQVTFKDGQRSSEITVDVLEDSLPEFDENIEVTLTEVSKGTSGSSAQATAVITILANDDPRGVIVFDPRVISTSETSGNATLKVKRLMGAAGTIRVHYTTLNTAPSNRSADGIAIADLDYRNVTDSVLMSENVTAVDVVIPVYNDITPETDEVFFVKLVATELVSSGVKVPNSPRLGSDKDTLTEIIIRENDSPHGVLELSSTSVIVQEDLDGGGDNENFLNVTRKLGTFGDVTVSVNVVPGTARPQEDYNLITSQVTLLEGESMKSINIRIIDDFTPEVEEDFTVQLLPDSIVGGASLGDDVTCRVIIDKSDDPYGALEISAEESVVDEPPDGEELSITFTVNRRNGRRGVVACKWQAFIEPASTAAASGDGKKDGNSADDGKDVDVREGKLHFVTNDTVETFTLRVLPDDLPEDDEVLRVRLIDILPGYQGRIDRSRDTADIVILANDRPYGDFALGSETYLAYEKEQEDSFARLKVVRSGGLYGSVRVVYSTSEIDLVSEMLEKGNDLLKMYHLPRPVQDIITIPEVDLHSIDTSSSEKPDVTCAEACLREKVCAGFVYSAAYYDCKWMTDETLNSRQTAFAAENAGAPRRYMFYAKNHTKTSFLYNSQAKSGLDFVPVTGASVILNAGQSSADIDIKILNDHDPELNEFFKLNLLSVEMLDVDSDQTSLPRLLDPISSRITIHENDHPYGLFVLRSSSPDSSNESSEIKVKERPHLSLEMVVERQGGAVGDVTVDWSVVGGKALRNEDFAGDDATLKFVHGEMSKVISLTVLDDDVPEPNEDIDIRLSNPTGGAVVSESHNRTQVVILANDRVGGLIGFRNDSRAVIGHEGEMITLHVERSPPALGFCEVTWFAESVSGHTVEHGLNFTQGLIAFLSGQTNASFPIYLTPDSFPETQEEYKIVLSSAKSFDIAASGRAMIDSEFSESEISIEESDDPHGIFRITPTSQRIDVKENDGTLNIFISRQFGSIGRVRVYYDVIPGTLSTLNPDIEVAHPGRDFIYDQSNSYVDFENGVTSVPIVMQIVDDDIPELNEIFHVNLTRVQLLTDVSEVTLLLPPKIDAENTFSQVVIDANDGTKGVVRFHSSSINVSAKEKPDARTQVRLQIVRDRGTYGEVDVFVFPQNKQAFVDKDFYCKQETVTFADGQTSAEYVVDILDDEIPEGDETFDIILNNPSNGLVLGNATRATITIESNDDAHGRLAFESDSKVFLDEPEGKHIANSRVELVVSRSPLDGTFGRISVRYKIEQISADGDVIPGPVNDLTPTQGYVIIEDEIRRGVFEVAVTVDNDPELEECFRVTLFEPTSGATLNDTGTSNTICVRENDAPYGDFRVYPKGSRNATRDMRVPEGSGNKELHLEVVRQQGLLGRVVVDVQAIPGTALPLKMSYKYRPALTPLQTLEGKGGVFFDNFDHGGQNYLIFLTSNLIGAISTSPGGDGTLSSLTSGVHSTLYKWEGVYVPVQTIETDGASSSTSFRSNGQIYIFICNSGETGRRESSSRLLELTASGELTAKQDVDTKGASSVTHFKIADVDYLVVTNSMDNSHVSSIDSSVLRFDAKEEILSEIQTLPTRGAAGSAAFRMGGYIYLAIANRYDSETGNNAPVSSVIYRWDPSSTSFIGRKLIDVSHATDVKHFEVDQKNFLVATSVIVERGSVSSTFPEVIKIFQVLSNDMMGNIILRSHQTINLEGANMLEIGTIPVESLDAQGRIQENFVRDGSVLMLCAASENKSCCYIFNYASEFFIPAVRTFPARHMLPHVVNDTTRSLAVVAVATSSSVTRPSPEFTTSHDPFGLSHFSLSGIYDFMNFHHTNDTTLDEAGVLQPDYVPFPSDKTLVFGAGETVRSIVMTILDDELPEDTETFKIALGNSRDSRAVVDDEQSSLTIHIPANDDAHGVIGFANNSLEKSVEETSRDNTFTLNVARAKSSYGRMSVDWTAYGSINDIAPFTGQVVFNDGERMVGIQITVLADDIPEIEELVTIQLSNPRLIGATSSSPPRFDVTKSASTVRILANDSPHGVVSWTPSSLHTVVSEAETLNGASQLVTLEMARQQGALGDIEVFFNTEAATSLPKQSRATPGGDFVSRDSSLVMRENSTRAAISISIIPDDVPEDIESFYVIITDVKLIGESEYSTEPGIGRPGTEIAEVTIDENDNSRGFIQLNITRNEEGVIDAHELPRINNTLKIPLMRVVGFFRAVGVEWLATPGTAKNADFFPSSGTVHFASGQKQAHIEIFITDDQDVEFLESFHVQLVASSGGAELGGDLTVTVNILPNDSPSGTFGFLKLSQQVDESISADDPLGVVEFKVQRFQGDAEDVVLTWELEKSAREDLTPTSGKLIFPSNARSRSIVLRTLPDQTVEGEEKFRVVLTSVTGGAEISPVANVAEVIIKANPGAAGVVSFMQCDGGVLTSEPENGNDGITRFMLERGPNAFGRVAVEWQIILSDTATFEKVQGTTFFEDMQNSTSITVRTINDDIPEMAFDYKIRLIDASGGAVIKQDENVCPLTVVASDSPHGTFEFSQPIYHVKESDNRQGEGVEFANNLLTTSSMASSYASVTVLRKNGHVGEVAVSIETSAVDAVENVDYYPIKKRLLFTDGDHFKVVDIEIIDDHEPEGPRKFFVNITDIEFLSSGSLRSFSNESGGVLSRDAPPKFGNISSAAVRIAKSDGAEGKIEFASSQMEIQEGMGTMEVPLVRTDGSYGSVSAAIIAFNQTALRNVDFLLPSAGLAVSFEDEQTTTYANIPIVDDEEMEAAESFSLELINPVGGARLGDRKTMQVVIRKSDYPNGVLQFIGDTEVVIDNPPATNGSTRLRFEVERAGGYSLPVIAKWRMSRTSPFILPTTSTNPLSEDILPPFEGVLQFANGEGGRRFINIVVLPGHAQQEVEENFLISIEEYSPAELNPDKGNATLTIRKKGHPNGIVRFDVSADAEMKVVNEPASGFTQLNFPITRGRETLGDVNVSWSVTPVNHGDGADAGDLREAAGHVSIYNGQSSADIVVNIASDDVPEISERFILELTSVDGGAELDPDGTKRSFLIRENDDPYGVFGVVDADQLIYVDGEMQRILSVNVTRRRGSFGRVMVGFEVYFDEPEDGTSYLTTNTGTVDFHSGAKWSTVKIRVKSFVFLSAQDAFTVRLTSLEHLDGQPPLIESKFSSEKRNATVVVPPEAANPQVGFDSVVSHVVDAKRDACELTLIRVGLYGQVTVQWSSGYSAQRAPLGRTIPESGQVVIDNLQESANISLKVLRINGHPDTIAVHLTQVNSRIGGGARMLNNRNMVEIDPSGAVGFAEHSRNFSVDHGSYEFNLTVERLYGSRYDISIGYVITQLTAQPGIDFVAPDRNDVIVMKDGEVNALIPIKLIQTSAQERSKRFMVNLTTVEQPLNIYRGLSPRLLPSRRVSYVTIPESRDARGVFAFSQTTIRTREEAKDRSDVLILMLTIHRKEGQLGDVSVMVSSAGGGEAWDEKTFSSAIPSIAWLRRRIDSNSAKRASAGLDYEVRQTNVSFKDGQAEAYVPVVVLDDALPEPEEAFFLYLHSPSGGARISPDKGSTTIIIEANDVPNGRIGFDRKNHAIDEDSPTRSVDLQLTRTHTYGEATLQWKAMKFLPDEVNVALNSDEPTTESTLTSSVDYHADRGLEAQLEVTAGEVTCASREVNCVITLTMQDDDVAEFAESFYVILYNVSKGAKIDDNRRVANVTMLDSDAPYGMFEFALSSRFPVATKGTKSVGLTIKRVGGDITQASVEYSTHQLHRVVTIAGTTLYPAVSNVDFMEKRGSITFQQGEREAYATVDLLPDGSSANPFPQLFQVVLDRSSGNSQISRRYNVANVTIVASGETKKVWAVHEALQQNLDGVVLHDVLSQLHTIASDALDKEKLAIFHGCLDEVLREGKRRRLSDPVLKQIYELFCKLLNPDRSDAVRGHSAFSASFEQFALCLVTGSECIASDVVEYMTSCSLAVVQALRWFPELINGHVFTGSGGDYFQLPKDLLDATQYGFGSTDQRCFDVHFVEYSSQLWFDVQDEKFQRPMSSKIFSVGVDGKHATSLSTPVRYRVHTTDARISPQGAECVLWNEASSRWLSTAIDVCRVVDDSKNFVDCECHHMSTYAASGPTDNLAGYNEATYAACFIAAVGALIIVLNHHLCTKRTTFAAKLMSHMCFACAMTQIVFVIGALTSSTLSQASCAAMGIFLHYFWLAQFTWILMQSINILQVLAFSNENTHRLYTVHFILGWGFPAIVILLYVIIMYAVGSKSLFQSYGDVHQNGDMCTIMNSYGALLGAVVPASLCILAPITFGFHLYQKDKSWKHYDDVFRGKCNSTEIPLLFWTFFFIAFTWLWGGLHLTFGYMWMLVLFIMFNFCQGFYFLITYGVLHNQLLKPTKEVYEDGLEKNGEAQRSTLPAVGYATSVAHGSKVPSISGEVINKSTQSLVPMLESTWEQTIGSAQLNDIDHDGDSADEDADFNDLMYALNAGSQTALSSLAKPQLPPEEHEAATEADVVKLFSDDDSIADESPAMHPGSIKTTESTFPIHDTHL